MKLFIDSADLSEIKTAASWGIIDGVTTNPTLASKQNIDFKKNVKEICKAVKGPVSVEVLASDATQMAKEGEDLFRLDRNVVIKLPCTFEGLKASKILHKQKIPTNITLVFSPNQVLLAAKSHATYISPFVGRLDDTGEDGIAMIAESLQIIKNYRFDSQIIVASVRSPLTVQKAAFLGAHVSTVPYKILQQMCAHPLTDSGIKQFEQDWKNRIK